MEKFSMRSDRLEIKGKAKGGKVKVVRYDRSFRSRIIQDQKAKGFYNSFKNYCLSFERVKVRPSWGAEGFQVGTEVVVKLAFLGGALCALFSLDPSRYNQKDYPHGDLSSFKEHKNTPMMVPLRTPSEYKLARRLAGDAFTSRCSYTVDDPVQADYASALPMEKDDALIKKGLIKVSETEMGESDAKKALAAALQAEAEEEKILERLGSKRRTRKKAGAEEEKPLQEMTSADEPMEDISAPIVQKSAAEEQTAREEVAPKEVAEEEKKEQGITSAEDMVEEVVFEMMEDESEQVPESPAEEPLAEESTLEAAPQEVQEQEVQEQEAQEQEAQEEAQEKEESKEETSEENEEEDVEEVVFELGENGIVIAVTYDRSFTARLIQNEVAKAYYSEIKNHCLSYGLKPRMSWKAESFYLGRNTYVRAKVNGKTLCLYLALDPKAYEDSTLPFKDVSDKKTYEKTPMLVRVRSDLGLRRAKRLIEVIAEQAGLTKKETPLVDYAAALAYEQTDALLEKGLIKKVKKASETIVRAQQTESSEQTDKKAETPVLPIASEPEQEEPEEVVFELSDEEIEDVTFELAGEEEEEDIEDVTFELAEQTPQEQSAGMESYGVAGKEEKLVTLRKYVRGFSAKMCQGDVERKEYYAAIKSALLSFRGVKVKASFPGETFKKGAKPLLKSRIRGKALCLFFALDTDSYKQTIYRQQYRGDTKAYVATPMMVRVKSEQGLKRAMRLIEELQRVFELKEGEAVSALEVQKQYLYEETPALVEKGLIKTRLVTVTEYEAEAILKKQAKG